jgi:hypothetical protein
VAAGNIQHIFRLAQAGNAAAQVPHQFLAVCNGGAQMCRSRRQITVMQVVGFDSIFDKSPHQGFQRRRIVVDAAKQHRLAHQRNACISQPSAGIAGFVRKFARMIGVHGNPCRHAVDA